MKNQGKVNSRVNAFLIQKPLRLLRANVLLCYNCLISAMPMDKQLEGGIVFIFGSPGSK